MPVFLAPWFLVGALAAGIPIALHFLHRRRPSPVAYSTLRFLSEAIARTHRSRRLTHVLTLLFRVLILLLLALAFSRPTVRDVAWLPKGKRNVILVLDGSASMTYREGDESCFERALEWARRNVEQLESGDRVAVLVPGTANEKLIFPPISDHARVARELEKAEPGDGSTDLANALSRAARYLQEEDVAGLVEFHVFSDFQRSAWEAAKLEDVSAEGSEGSRVVFLNRVSPRQPVNAGLEKAVFHPPALVGEARLEIEADVRLSPDYRDAAVLSLHAADGRELARESVTAVAGRTGRQLIQAQVAGGESGYFCGELVLNKDALARDNVYRFCLSAVPKIPVLLVDGSAEGDRAGRETLFLKHAIQPRGQVSSVFDTRVAGWDMFRRLTLTQFQVVFVCNPPQIDAAVAGKLTTFARDGGTVVVYPGAHNALPRDADNLAVLGEATVRKEVLPRETARQLVRSENPDDFELRLQRVLPAMPQLTLRRRLIIRWPEKNGVRHVFNYPDGAPFLTSVRVGDGSFWLASVSANRDWSEWPLSPFFVIFQRELIGRATRQHLPAPALSVGDRLPLSQPSADRTLDVEIEHPDGTKALRTVRRRQSQNPFLVGPFLSAGFYRLRYAGSERRVAVNTPAAETDLTYRTSSELGGLSVPHGAVYVAESWREQQRHVAGLRFGRPVWPLLLALAFFLAVAEELFANMRSWAASVPRNLQEFLQRGGRTV